MSAGWTCTQCGALNSADAFQCGRCGALNYSNDDQEQSASKKARVEEVNPSSDPFPFALVGKNVIVNGLSKKPELNGARGLVQEFDLATQRYTVAVDGGRGTFKLKRENLLDLSAQPAKAEAPVQQADPFVGRLIEVQGLNARPELNGMRGVIKESDSASGRFTVELDGGLGQFKLKPDNLKDLTEVPAPHQQNGAEAAGGSQGAPPRAPQGMPAGQTVRSINVTLLDKGAIIGSGGAQINKIRQESGAYCQIETSPVDPDAAILTLRGSDHALDLAEKMVRETLEFANRPREQKQAFVKKTLEVEKAYTAGVIGKGGCFLKEMAAQSQCKIFFQSASELDPTAAWDKQVCVIQGTPEQLPYAEQLVWAKVAEVSKSMEGKTQSWEGKSQSWEVKAQSWEDKAQSWKSQSWDSKDTEGKAQSWGASSREPPAKKEVCKFFQSGWCGFGDECSYSHEGPSQSASAPEPMATPWMQPPSMPASSGMNGLLKAFEGAPNMSPPSISPPAMSPPSMSPPAMGPPAKAWNAHTLSWNTPAVSSDMPSMPSAGTGGWNAQGQGSDGNGGWNAQGPSNSNWSMPTMPAAMDPPGLSQPGNGNEGWSDLPLLFPADATASSGVGSMPPMSNGGDQSWNSRRPADVSWNAPARDSASWSSRGSHGDGGWKQW